MPTMTSGDVYAAVIGQTVHDGVRVVLDAPPGSLAGSRELHRVAAGLGAEHGDEAVRDAAEELAVDLAEAVEALAAAEGRPALAVLDGWFPGVAVPYVAAVAASGSMKDGEDPGGLDRPARPRGGTP
jgi:hypothetical protein